MAFFLIGRGLLKNLTIKFIYCFFSIVNIDLYIYGIIIELRKT